jgi:predicted RNA-binding protein YlxR (DUF448 family)
MNLIDKADLELIRIVQSEHAVVKLVMNAQREGRAY